MYDLVVTADRALVTYLNESGIVDPSVQVKYPAKAEDVRGKHVIGKLPHSLSCRARSYTEIPMNLPPVLEGMKRLPADYDKYADDPIIYTVKKHTR